MQMVRKSDRYVIARENNVLRVNFERNTDPPGPQFPGAGALRSGCARQFERGRWLWNQRVQQKSLANSQRASGPR
jgi:hypothetical protein